MIKRIIFDIDGTLLTGINFDKAITESLLKYNFFSEENKQKFFNTMIPYEDNYNEYEKNQYTQYFSKVLCYRFDNDFLDIHFKNLLTYGNTIVLVAKSFATQPLLTYAFTVILTLCPDIKPVNLPVPLLFGTNSSY